MTCNKSLVLARSDTGQWMRARTVARGHIGGEADTAALGQREGMQCGVAHHLRRLRLRRALRAGSALLRNGGGRRFGDRGRQRRGGRPLERSARQKACFPRRRGTCAHTHVFVITF